MSAGPASLILLRIRQLGGNVPVAIFPSDHYVSDDALFVGAVGVEWSDCGHPQRVMATMRRTGWRPAWFGRVELASAG